MPELPEVETVKRILNTFLPGAEIKSVDVLKKGLIVGDVPNFISTLKGQTFQEVKRIGKYLIFTFSSDLILLSHLRMEGKFLEIMPGEELSRFAHIIFTLNDGRRLVYDDSRQFGKLEISTESTYLATKSLLNVGLEPFNINPVLYSKAIEKRGGPIKLTLLDQKLMSGLGNIYVDEVLFRTNIHPLTPTNKLTLPQVELLVKESILVLNEAIIAGGTTVRSYTSARGQTGHFQQELFAYGREGKECKVCKSKMKKIFVGGRGTTYCPSCQMNPYAPCAIAITGQKAAGKSVICSYLRDKGNLVYDTDKMAKALYDDPQVVRKIEQSIGKSFTINHHFNFEAYRNYLQEFPSKITIVNKILHPLVKDEISAILKNTTAKVVYFEIPLVFSHKINELFTTLIGVELSKQKQEENLAIRGQSLGINPDAMYLKNRHRVDFILINDGSKEDLINKFKVLKVPCLRQ